MPVRRGTSTSNFGVGRRESHDASGFYARFRPPELSDDDTVLAPAPVAEPFVCGDARHLDTVADGSVALVVTSPPYFAGKAYEEELGRDGVPGSYLEYLELLHDVFAQCCRKLEPGGRIAVNVANLGRRPYRSLSADVIRILQDELGLLLRGELIWQKAEGATGSCAWGSFRSAANPVLRDLTERVVVASKGRFDRAGSVRSRAAAGLPYESTLTTEDFMALTLDVWSIPPERARRVGHPAPFPLELPEQLIRLYSFAGDLVLDPFMGSGSTLVAAALLGRRYAGYDLEPAYVAIARARVGEALAAPAEAHEPAALPPAARPVPTDAARPVPTDAARPVPTDAARPVPTDAARPVPTDAAGLVPAPHPPAGTEPARAGLGRPRAELRARAAREGKTASALAEEVLVEAGFALVARDHRPSRTGVVVDFVAEDAAGDRWLFEVVGPFTTHRGGMARIDTVFRLLGRAHILRGRLGGEMPFVALTTELPRAASEGDVALRAAGPEALFDVIDLLGAEERRRLSHYAAGGRAGAASAGFWSAAELSGRDVTPPRRGRRAGVARIPAARSPARQQPLFGDEASAS